MSTEGRWLEDEIGTVMGYVRGARTDPSLIDEAEAAIRNLRDVAADQHSQEAGAVVSSIESAIVEFEASHATMALQHLSRALMLVSRFSV
jgi:hypothetical protein